MTEWWALGAVGALVAAARIRGALGSADGVSVDEVIAHVTRVNARHEGTSRDAWAGMTDLRRFVWEGPVSVSVDDPRFEPVHPASTRSVRAYARRIGAGELPPAIVVTERKPGGRWALEDGAHRLTAARRAGLATIPVYIGRASVRGSFALATWYHGTTPKDAARILRVGLDVERERAHDPGDFGWGVYLTRDPVRARSYGEAVLDMRVEEDRLAYVQNPYFIVRFDPVEPKTPEEKLFHALAFGADGEMRTVKGRWAARVEAAREVRDAFLAAGYTGIRSDYLDGEMVIFDPSIVRRVRAVPDLA